MPEELSGEKKALEVSGEMPLVEGVETDEELLLARDLISALVKTVKAFRFYPPDNPTLKGFREQLFKKFQFFLSKYPIFVFQIGEFDLSFKGKVLYENRDIKSSLAFLLYKYGLRELRFMKGLEEAEVNGLIETIKRADNINLLEDDLVTLLWERDFSHISYLATDEVFEETPAFVPESVDQFRRNLIFQPPAHHVETDLLEGEADDHVTLDEILLKMVEEPPSVAVNRSVYSLTPDEVEALRKEVEAEADPTFVFNVVDILFEVLALEKEQEPYQDAANVLIKVLDALITLGDFQKASDALKRAYIVLKTYDLKDWQMETIRKLIVDVGEDQRIERIGRVLEREEGIRPEDVNGYLVLLQKNAIKPLIQLLGELKNSKTRRILCDALAEIGKNSIELIVPSIEDRRWYLVRNIVYVLGRIGKEQSLPYLQKVFSHEDLRVRREVIQALGLIGGPKAIGLLGKALTDDDIRIRSTAAINLGKIGKSAGLGPLLEVVQSKDFQKKEPVEIKAFFDAIGMVGSNEAIPILQQLLERKGWFARGKLDELRLGAANALAMLRSPEAKAILEAGRSSKDDGLREACTRAMRSYPT
ncbi:MAG: HEAT repeat domain-containing protein [Deltaproteobacteria bacterium]|nr:MAG: HEAT repeat domain-containing protein [Deltaproteobacteria bacterium]